MRLLATLVALTLIVAACTTSGTQDTTTTDTGAPTTPASGDVPPDDVSEVTETTSGATDVEPIDTTPVGIEDLPTALRVEILELVEATQRLRQLNFLEAPIITVVDDVELAERVRESIAEEAEGIDADEALYQLLGLLSTDTDLLALYTDLYGEQVAGYYDGDEGELVIPSNESLSPLQRATLVHELTHALTDQHFAMNDAYETLIDAEDFDAAAAYLSVIEGDATLTEVLYIQDLPPSDQQELISESLEADSSVFDTTPSFISDSLIFPYQEGFGFTQRLFQLGGFDEIGRAYLKPPQSTEQIIEPRDFGRDLPIEIAASVRELDGYELIYDSVWGELGFDTMFTQILGGDVARTASDGWGGDRFTYFYDGAEAALVLEYRGDREIDTEEMQQALFEYVSKAMDVGPAAGTGDAVTFTGNDFAAIRRDGVTLTFVAASDPVLGATLVSP